MASEGTSAAPENKAIPIIKNGFNRITPPPVLGFRLAGNHLETLNRQTDVSARNARSGRHRGGSPPISGPLAPQAGAGRWRRVHRLTAPFLAGAPSGSSGCISLKLGHRLGVADSLRSLRSEERRVGKEGRSRW